MIDHRAILLKYMRLVQAHEGTTFADGTTRERLREEGEDGVNRDYGSDAAELAFTEDEWAELQRLDDEVGPQPPLPAVHFPSLLTYETIRGETLPSTNSNLVVSYGTPPSEGAPIKPVAGHPCSPVMFELSGELMNHVRCGECGARGVVIGPPLGSREDGVTLWPIEWFGGRVRLSTPMHRWNPDADPAPWIEYAATRPVACGLTVPYDQITRRAENTTCEECERIGVPTMEVRS